MRTPPLFVTALSLTIVANTASAEDRTYSINIPAQALASALDALGRQTGLQPFYADGVLAGKRGAAFKGNYGKREALDKVLSGSGLMYTFTGDNTVAIKGQDQGAAETLAPVTVAGHADYDAVDPYSKDYAVVNASTATKTDTPIMETPMSIQVVPRAVMDDQQATRIEDVAKNVSGVQSSFNYGDEGYDFFIRGFNTSFNVFRNGFRAGDISGAPGTSNLERIEFLKGPASVLYGRVEPGGLINLVTKKPLFSPYYSLQQQFGSYDFYRTTVDATGPIGKDDSLAYRFNFEYLDKNSFREGVSTDRVFAAPSLTWRPTDATEINLMLEYAHVNGGEDQGIPAIGNRPAPIPISRSMVGNNNYQTADNIQIYLTGTHQLNKDWKVRGGFSGYWNDYNLNYLYHGNLQADNRHLNLIPIPLDNHEQRYGLYMDTTGHFEALGAAHEVLIGADYYLKDRELPLWFGDTIAQDIFNPMPIRYDYAALRATNPATALAGEEWAGIYFQDQITLWEKLHILAGGRYDWANTSSAFSGISKADAEARLDDRTDEKFNPRFGLLYQPWSWLSIYGNYVESLGANNGRNSAGSSLPPQLGSQYEAGLKTELFEGRLNAPRWPITTWPRKTFRPRISTRPILSTRWR